MAGTFDERMRQLGEDVGSGHLIGSVVVDQVYAMYQHERLDLHHPRGGHARYLAGPLTDHHKEYLQDYADQVLDKELENGRKSLRESMEHLSDRVEVEAPVEFTSLRRSGHPSVTDDGVIHYDRPPKQARLTEAEIRELRRAHSTGWKTINGHPVFVGGGDH